jgi:hypothetical protein
MTFLPLSRPSNEKSFPTVFSLLAPAYDEVQKHDMKDFDSVSVATIGSIPPLALPGVDFVLQLAHTYIGGNDHGALQRHNVIVPVDGGSQWYCSECKDGPYLDWQVSCQNCHHAKCGSCSSEKM